MEKGAASANPGCAPPWRDTRRDRPRHGDPRVRRRYVGSPVALQVLCCNCRCCCPVRRVGRLEGGSLPELRDGGGDFDPTELFKWAHERLPQCRLRKTEAWGMRRTQSDLFSLADVSNIIEELGRVSGGVSKCAHVRPHASNDADAAAKRRQSCRLVGHRRHRAGAVEPPRARLHRLGRCCSGQTVWPDKGHGRGCVRGGA